LGSSCSPAVLVFVQPVLGTTDCALFIDVVIAVVVFSITDFIFTGILVVIRVEAIAALRRAVDFIGFA
jgi:hypothetical protein